MPLRFISRHPRKIAALAVLAALGVAAIGLLIQSDLGVSDAMAALKKVAQWCVGINPAMYVIALGVLPYVGVPSLLFYTVAGKAYGIAYGFLWTSLGVALNLTVGYFIGSRWLRGPISRWMEKRGRRLPEVPPGEVGKLVVLSRLLPGPPLIAQNFLLALAGVPFWPYFLYSLPITLMFAAAVLLTSGAAFQGNLKLVITGVCLIISLSLLAHVANAYYKARRRKRFPPATPPRDS